MTAPEVVPEPAAVSLDATKRAALISLAPPAAALSYPFLLDLFHQSVTHHGVRWAALSSLLLLAAIAAPLSGIYTFWKLGANETPSPAEIRARALALLAVASAPIYTTLGVVLTIAHNPVSDLVIWLILWSVACAILLWPRLVPSVHAPAAMPTFHPRLRYAHGVSAALIVCLFLAMHLLNHLSALWSLEDQRVLMNAFRHIYRSGLVEPLLVALMLFQVVTGPVLLWQYLGRSVDLRRTLQVASGAYLLFYIPGHMNSVFVYARAIARIPTDWNFATGAPAGILLDAWNIRLLPHYLLAVFFVMTHLTLGARIVALAHHVSLKTVNHLAAAGIVGAGLLAVAIMAGMVGIHLAP